MNADPDQRQQMMTLPDCGNEPLCEGSVDSCNLQAGNEEGCCPDLTDCFKQQAQSCSQDLKACDLGWLCECCTEEEDQEVHLERGKTQGKLEMARNMLADGMPPNVVAQYTGLPEGEIRSLQ
jgi:hypothetical protein